MRCRNIKRTCTFETCIDAEMCFTICVCCLQGQDAVPFLEKLVVGDIKGVENGSGTLSVFTNEKGGIIDDSVITKVWH